MVLKFPFFAIIVVDAVQHVAVKIFPLLEAERFPEDAGIYVAGHERCLDQNCARAAERIDEIRIALPSGELYQSGGKDFVDRSFALAHTIAAQVQALARGIERKSAIVVRNVDIEFDIGVGDTNIRALAGRISEVVDDSVLYFVRHELRVAEFLRIDDGIYGKGGIEVEVVVPIYGTDGGIYLIGIRSFEMLDGFEDTHSGTQAEVGTIHHFLVTAKGDHSSSYLNFVCAQLGKFLCQDFFQSLKGLGNHFKLFH